MTAQIKELKLQLREHRREMREAGIQRTSPFNGGMSRESQRANERRFALESQIKDLEARAAIAKATQP